VCKHLCTYVLVPKYYKNNTVSSRIICGKLMAITRCYEKMLWPFIKIIMQRTFNFCLTENEIFPPPKSLRPSHHVGQKSVNWSVQRKQVCCSLWIRRITEKHVCSISSYSLLIDGCCPASCIAGLHLEWERRQVFYRYSACISCVGRILTIHQSFSELCFNAVVRRQ
jgi:hypothetical protein